MIRAKDEGQKPPPPPVGTPRGGNNLDPTLPVLIPPTVPVSAENGTGNTVTAPPVTRYAPSRHAIKQKAYRERLKKAAPERIAVPCHPDHLVGLDG